MSAYGEFETMIRERRFLVEALTEMGYVVETHPEGAALIGYHGDERPERAEVIIRRAQLDSASNDIGFVREKDGRFRAIVSEYDRSIGYDDKWLGTHEHGQQDKETTQQNLL